MRKYLLILFTLASLTSVAQIFPTPQAAKNFSREELTSAVKSFTKLTPQDSLSRIQYLIKGIIEIVEAGGSGGNSTPIVLRNTGTYIQWKYDNEPSSAWRNLIAVADITGAQGPTGATGAPGASVELQKTSSFIQWRQVGSLTWNNLISIAEITGPPGSGGGGGGTPAFADITGSANDNASLAAALLTKQPIGQIFFTGLATALSGVTVPNTFPIIQTSGWSVAGKGGAKYVRDTLTTPTRFRFQTQDGQWWRLSEENISIEMFGAIGDSTDATAAIQAALDYTRSAIPTARYGTGTAIHFSGGKFLYSKLTIHSGNLLTDNRVQGKGGFNYTNGNGAALIHIRNSIPNDSFSIVTDNNASGWGINGLQIIGGGVGADTLKTGGIKVHGIAATDWRITNNTIKGWGIEAVVANGTPYVIQFNMIQGCNNIGYVVGKGVPTGVIRASGADATIMNNEFTGSQNQAGSGNMVTPSADQLIGAAYFGGLGVSKLQFNIYQVAECGLRHPGGNNRYSMERFDTNAGSGLYFTSGGSDNRFEQIQVIRNSLAGTGVYDAIYADVTGGRNYFDGVEFGAGAPYSNTTYQTKLYINDLKADLGTNNAFVNSYANLYYSSLSADPTMFKFFGVSEGAGRVIVPQGGPFRRIIGATPTVTLGSNYMAYNASATSITNFRGGVAGQEIGLVWSPLAGGNTWVKHGDSIKLRKGVDSIQLNDLVVEKFIYNGKFWLQTTGASAGEGTYQPLNLYLSQLSALTPGNGAFLSYDNGWKTFTSTQQRNRMNVFSKEEVQYKIDSVAALGGGGGAGVTDGDKGEITVSGGGTVWNVDVGLSATKIGANTNVSNTEYGYLDGVSSPIQAQINGRASTQALADSMTALRGSQYLNLGFGLNYRLSDTALVIDTASAGLKSYIATYGGGGGSAPTTDASALTTGTLNDARLSSNVTQNTATQTLTNKTLSAPVFSGAYSFGGTPTFPTAVTQNTATQTLTNKTMDGGSNTFTNIPATALPNAGTSAAGILTANQYNRLYTRQTSANPTGTITVNVNNGAQIGITFTATGARTLAFSNHVAGDLVKIAFDNTSGATVALTLPSNSFSAGTGSAASVTIPTGKSVLSLVDYDGTNYYFSLQSY